MKVRVRFAPFFSISLFPSLPFTSATKAAFRFAWFAAVLSCAILGLGVHRDSIATGMALGDEPTDASGTRHPSSSATSPQPRVSRCLFFDGGENVDAILDGSPLLSAVTDLTIRAEGKLIPTEAIRQIARDARNLRSLSIEARPLAPSQEQSEVDDTAMEYIGRLKNLQQLGLACRCSPGGFAHLAGLTELRAIGLSGPAISAADFFRVISKLPKIERVGIRFADFSRPIDEETFQAIASMNGRLESLSFGEWGETTIHVSMIPAIARIESLRRLELGNFIATYEECEPLRQQLVYLDSLGPNVRELADIPTTQQCSWKAASPIQASTVRLPAEMQRLLRAILGTLPANAVRKEVVRRRAAGQTELVDYTASPRPLPEILHDSFGIDLNPKATETFQAIARDNPNLDMAIRRFLSGRKELGASSSHDR